MSKYELIHSLKLFADHVRKPRSDAEQIYWDMELDKHARAGAAANPYYSIISGANTVPREKLRTADQFRPYLEKLVASCDSEEQKADVLQMVNTWRTKNPLHWQKLVEMLSKIGDDDELKSAMAKQFASKTEFTLDHASSPLALKVVDPKEMKQKLKLAAGGSAPRLRDSSTSETTMPSLHFSALTQTEYRDLEPVVSADDDVDAAIVEFSSSSEKFGTIGQYPFFVQENIVVGDLIWCLLGKSGCYILAHNSTSLDSRSYEVDHTLDVLLRNKVIDFFPLLKNIWIIERYLNHTWAFVSRRGRVGQSVAACVRSFLYEFRLYVTRVDDGRRAIGGMNLSSLWACFQDSKFSFELLARIAKAVMSVDLRGGQILSFVRHNDLFQGCDERALKVMHAIQRAAFEPFLGMLETWLYRGEIDDPFEEFMLRVDGSMVFGSGAPTRLGSKLAVEGPPGILKTSVNKVLVRENIYFSEDFWANTYSLRDELVPVFLHGVPAQQVVDTGKYLNVIKKCGQTFKCPFEGKIPFTEADGDLLSVIGRAHGFASHCLLKFLIDQHDLLGILAMVKHYFLLDQADFMEEFMILCDAELGGCIGDANINRLNTLLELALRISIGANERHKDHIRGVLKQYGLEAEMKRIMSISTQDERECAEVLEGMSVPVWEALTLMYDVKWPISIVLTNRAQTCYQMLFRHFFHLKRVARVLCRARCNVRTNERGLKLNRTLSRNIHALKLKMVHFVQTLEHGMVFDVVEPAWQDLMERIENATSMDQVLLLHTEFTDACLKDCMLQTPRLLQILRRILDVCLQFSAYLEKPGKAGGIRFDDSLEQTMKRIDLKFCGFAFELMKVVFDDGTEFSPKLKNIVRRLNYNAFYEDWQ